MQTQTDRWEKVENTLAISFFIVSLLVMFYEVLARYVLKVSVFWYDEVVRFTMVYAMFFGSCALVKDDGHTSMKLLVNKLNPTAKAVARKYTQVICLIYTLFLVYCGGQLVWEAFSSGVVSESRLELPLWIAYAIIPLGGVMMCVRWVQKIIQDKLPAGWYKNPAVYIILVVLLAVLWLVFFTDYILVALFVALFFMLLLGTPVAFSLAASSAFVILSSDMVSFSTIASKQFYSMSKFSLLAIPFYTLVGCILCKSIIGVSILELLRSLLKRFTGGMGIAIMFVSMIFAAMSGSSSANAAALGLICIPMLASVGYPKRTGAGILGSGGTLAVIIPPSIILVLYGATAGASITDLFTAGLVPGIMLGLMICVYIYFIAKRGGFDVGNKSERIDWKEVWQKFKKSFFGLLMPIVVLGSIYTGIATPTEAAVVASIYALVICLFIYRDLKFSDLIGIFRETIKLSSMIYFIVMASGLLSYVITHEQLPLLAANFVTNANIGRIGFLVLLNILLLICGCFLGSAAIIVMVVPVIAPIASALGIDLVHLGILLTINMEIGFLTPPVGSNLFILTGVSKLPVEEVIKGTWPFIVILFVGLLIVTFVPWVSLCLL